MDIFNLDDTVKRARISAIALKYDSSKERAPKLAAKGQGIVAEEIIRIAKENDIQVLEDPNLLGLLMPLELEEEIPPELYEVVAELLAFIYKMENKVKI